MKLRPKDPSKPRPPGRTKRVSRNEQCPCCKETVLFCWSCACGFRICQACMTTNAWGLTCNYITWICPDCGATRSY